MGSNIINSESMELKSVQPITLNGIKYSVESTGTIGIIKAENASTKEITFTKEIFKVKLKQNLEKDVQLQYFNSLEIKDGFLITEYGTGKKYKLNLKETNPLPVIGLQKYTPIYKKNLFSMNVYIQATYINVNTHEETISNGEPIIAWEKKLYTIWFNPFKNKAHQEIYLTSLTLNNFELKGVDQRGKEYRLNVEGE